MGNESLSAFQSMNTGSSMKRRNFLKVTGITGSFLGAGLILGTPPTLWGDDPKTTQTPPPPPARIKTNVEDVLKVPRTKFSLPGLFPGRVVEVHDPSAITNDKFNGTVIKKMVEKGITSLTGKNMKESFKLFFNKNDVVGIKVNPVGGGLISTRLEVVDAVIEWLKQNGIPAQNIIIWDRFDQMLKDAGFTAERFPGVGIEALQIIDETAASDPTKDNSRWMDKNGKHLSEDKFDMNVYYSADIEGPKDLPYLNQHVVNGKISYFGKLITQKLTKIINIPVFKNTGNGVSMATKNLGYGAICNTGRLHRPLSLEVNTEVLAFPCLRDKVVLNINDGLRAQYDGGPMPNAQFTYLYNTMFFATDMLAMDTIGHNIMFEKRKEMKVKDLNDHPKYTEYLRLGEKFGLGITDPKKIKHIKA